MNLKYILTVLFFVAISIQISNCGVIIQEGNDGERDMNFLIKKIEDIMKDDERFAHLVHDDQEHNAEAQKTNDAYVIHQEDESKSFEAKKSAAHEAVVEKIDIPPKKTDEKVKKEAVPKKYNPENFDKKVQAPKKVKIEYPPKNIQPKEVSQEEELGKDISSSIDAHVMRYDRNGNSLEEYKDSDEHEQHQEEEPQKKRKKKKSQKSAALADEDGTINLNSVINQNVIKQALQKKEKEEADEYYDEDEDDDVPLITIPMVDILRQYNRMQQGFISETEEYSDETTHDVFEDPDLKDILAEISAERKIVKAERKEGKKVKPAAKRVLERHGIGASDDSL